MKTAYAKFTDFLTNYFSDLVLLALRLLLAYEFYDEAMDKLYNFSETVTAFRDDYHMPMPAVMAFLATSAEVLGTFFLIGGFAVRFISVPLIITMIVAIFTVHIDNGFNVCDGGYKFPVYYIIMLSVLFTYGAGRIGIDYWLAKWIYRNQKA